MLPEADVVRVAARLHEEFEGAADHVPHGLVLVAEDIGVQRLLEGLLRRRGALLLIHAGPAGGKKIISGRARHEPVGNVSLLPSISTLVELQ